MSNTVTFGSVTINLDDLKKRRSDFQTVDPQTKAVTRMSEDEALMSLNPWLDSIEDKLDEIDDLQTDERTKMAQATRVAKRVSRVLAIVDSMYKGNTSKLYTIVYDLESKARDYRPSRRGF